MKVINILKLNDMRIVKITKEGDIYEVTTSPCLILELLGMKQKQKRYKDTGCKYHFFPSVSAYCNEQGEIIGPTHRITKAIENYRRSF